MSSLRKIGFLRAALLPLAALVALGGCGGEDGDRVGVATGQAPDPVVLDIPVAYIKRALPVDEDGDLIEDDVREVLTFRPGADVFVRDRASPSSPERNITFEITEGLGDVRDLTVSATGDKLAFALREPMIEDLPEDEQPTWNIWEYDLTDDTLRRVIASDIVAETGHDIAPAYLPDDRFVFSSTRQRTMKAILLDEGKPQFEAQDENGNEPAFLLHTMGEDGSGIEQISYNQSHDLDAVVLDDGRIAFSRWDNAPGSRAINLYTINPDGTDLRLLYGAKSHATGTDGSEIHFLKPEPLPDGQVLSLVRPFVSPSLGGDLVTIDAQNFVEIGQPVMANAGAPGPGQVAATVNAVRTDEAISTGGRYNAAFPLFDGTGRLFVSWSECRLLVEELIRPCTDAFMADPAAIEADPLYGLWIYDRTDGTQLPVVAPQEGVMYSDMVATETRPFPPVVPGNLGALAYDPSAVDDNVGVLHIRSVYDLDGEDTAPGGIAALADPAQTTAGDRTYAFVRIVKAVSQPDDDVQDVPRTAFGRLRSPGMREIIGYAAVEPDGSVMTKVPANVALSLDLLTLDGKRRGFRHDNWLQVRPGELLECNGCHRGDSELSHGRDDVFASINPGAPTTGLPFPNTDPALFADFGETMAQVRARISCTDDCAAITPEVDLVYTDVWTDPVAAGRAADAPFAWRYSDLRTPAPASDACQQDWNALCRTVIHYETHIHPLWALDRATLADDGVTVLSDYTCTRCHNDTDAAGQPQVPAGQLDLSDGLSVDQSDHFKAFRELVFEDNEQELVGGVLQDRLITVGVDPDTMLPILETVPVEATLGVDSAERAGAFFDRFDAGGAHDGYLSRAEIKLLVEWIDNGGQYYNDPFAVPQD